MILLMSNLFVSPSGTFTLNRFPPGGNPTLRAWDAADEYILQVLEVPPGPGSLVILNDSWGGLSCPLAGGNPAALYCFTDSLLSRRGIIANCRANNLAPPEFISPGDPLPVNTKTILVKIPKSLELFDYFISWLARDLSPGIPVIAGGLSRYLPPGFFKIFQSYTGDADSSLIKKKARVFQGRLAGNGDRKIYPEKTYSAPPEDLEIHGLPGIFSRGKPDPGSRFLLEHLPRELSPEIIVDPGCGNGLLGLTAAAVWKNSRVICTDESALAAASAKLSARANGLGDRVEIIQTHILEGVPDGTADLVLCNPPFHQQAAVSTETGRDFLVECARVLKPRGELLLVANRHLGYKNLLSRLFARVEIPAVHEKYSLFRCGEKYTGGTDRLKREE